MPDLVSNYSLGMSSEVFRQLLLQAASSIVWKNQALGNQYDQTLNSSYIELFMCAKRGLLNFDVIPSFDEDLLRQVGINGSRLYPMLAHKEQIPYEYRDQLVQLYVERLTAKDIITGQYTYYREENNYYRMLSGLPNIEDTEKDFVYITELNSPYPTDTPVHMMPLSTRSKMEQDGTMARLIEKYPTKKYLHYAATKSIDIFAARAASRFDLLYLDSDKGKFERDFREVYNQCKYVITSVYYSNAFKRDNDLYENFMAMSILFMAMVTMCHKYLTADITRDFYDAESIRCIYDSYGVPFYDEIPLEYHTKIAKQMNRLVSYKGSSTVFYDLFELFDSSSMNIYQYYLTKVHKFENNKPVFSYDENDRLIPEDMYTINFAKSDITSDPAMQVTDPKNYLDFPDLTFDDPYWVNDKDLMNTVFDETYNYNETKYIGIQTVLDVLGTTYENAYFFKMLQDNRNAIDGISTRWSVTNEYVSLFDFFCYLACLYCHKYGYMGEISSRLPYVGRCLGYNFKDEVKNFQELVAKDPLLSKDDRLVELMRSMNCNSLTSVNNTFQAINNLRKYLVEKMANTHVKSEFETYRAIYRILLTSENIEDSFRKSDGTIATDYDDMLADQDPTLFQRLISLNDDEIDDEIGLIIHQIEEMLPAVRNLNGAFGLDVNALIDSLFKVLQFFKSAKADLIGYNIVFMLSLRGVNFFKLMDEIDFISTTSWFDPEYLRPTDIMERMHEEFQYYEQTLHLYEREMGTYNESILEDYIDKLTDDLICRLAIWEPMIEKMIPTDFMIGAVEHLALDSALFVWNDELHEHKAEYLESKYTGTIDEYINRILDTTGELIGAHLTDELEEKGQSKMYLLDELHLVKDMYYKVKELIKDPKFISEKEVLLKDDYLIVLGGIVKAPFDHLKYTDMLNRIKEHVSYYQSYIPYKDELLAFDSRKWYSPFHWFDGVVSIEDKPIKKAHLIFSESLRMLDGSLVM